jgi:hypothetical protein
MELLTVNDYEPFEKVTITRVRDKDGEPTAWVVIEGLRQGGAREVRARYTDLWNQADTHLQYRHGKSMNDPMTPQEFAHATIRAAIAFLMD